MAIDIIARSMAGKAAKNIEEEETILPFNGTIIPNHKYEYSTDTDFVLQLDEQNWDGKDLQFVLYLECLADIDITFSGEPISQSSNFTGDPLFINGIPKTKTGLYKIIGFWNNQIESWCIGYFEMKEES